MTPASREYARQLRHMIRQLQLKLTALEALDPELIRLRDEGRADEAQGTNRY